VQHKNFNPPHKKNTEFKAEKRESCPVGSRKTNAPRNVTALPNKPEGGEGERRKRGRWKGKCQKMALQSNLLNNLRIR
jgi:hypothetical protein